MSIRQTLYLMASSTTIKTSDNKLDDEREKFQLSPYRIPEKTVTSLFGSGDPSIKSPEDAVKFLFPKHHHHLRYKIKHKIFDDEMTQEELDVAAKFGRFSERPSDLFLKVNRTHIQMKNIF
jgi:hypothetical protein